MAHGAARILSGDVEAVAPEVEAAVRRGSGRVVLLSGAPGAGKSTTMDALVRAVPVDSRRTVRVSADETSRRQPFGVVSAMVGMAAEYPPRPDTADRVLAAVETLCAGGPAVLCADDVHQADADSLRVLAQLVPVARDLPLVLLLTRRWFPVRESLTTLAAEAEVLAVEVVGVDAGGVAGIVRHRCGGEPGPDLRDALRTAGGNPFHVHGMLSDLLQQDRLRVHDGVVDLSAPGPPSAQELPSVQDGVRAQVSLLDRSARDLLDILAVWGRPASVRVLSAIADVAPGPLRASVDAAVELEVLRWSGPDELAFTHDLYRDVLYADLLPGMRRMLHAACAAELRTSGGIATEIVQHVGDSLADGVAVAEALRTAERDLEHAPEQAADLLAQVQARPGTPDADALAVARAGALAAAGRMSDVERVVRDALAVTRDPRVHRTLTRLLLHHLVSAAETADALALIDDELLHSTDEPYRDALTHLRRWILVLTGDAAPTGERPAGASGAALVPTALELFLQARCASALETVLEAERYRASAGSAPWSDGATAPSWPPWFALYAYGPDVAADYSLQARRQAQRTGRGWLFPQHLGVAGTIDQFAGRWDDALTVYEAHWEISTAGRSGWRSRGMGGLLQLQVQRGHLDEAAAGLKDWYATGHPGQFGLPWVEHAELLLAEARGDTTTARRLADRVWSDPLDRGCVLWALLAGPDVARVARWVGDLGLLERVQADAAVVPLDEVPALAAVPALVDAIATEDSAGASDAATALGTAGHTVGELYGWEEAAVAAAVGHDRAVARDHAARCLDLAGGLGALTVERRLAARLREHGVRLGATGARRRPATGLDSLTPTEVLVAERVSQGLTSPQIATQLYVSPRTVQTHISHILRKLDLRSRVELAALLARRAPVGDARG